MVQYFCLAALGVLAICLTWSGSRLRQHPLAFAQHDYLLIAKFENRTGDPQLDGVMETALRRELSDSRYMSVAPAARVEDALRLMGKPISTPLIPEIGREVCLRDGGIHAMLTGRIQKLGSAYETTTFLVDPADGKTVFAFSDTAQDQTQLLQAIHRVADSVRRRLGEDASAIQASGHRLEHVTTPSLEALQLYSQGEQAAEHGQWAEAEQLFRQAIGRDPQFASAMNMLAWSLHNQANANEGTQQQVVALLERANQLAETVSDREANFIHGTYYQLARNDPDRAIAAYKAVLDIYPNDPWCANNIYQLELSRGNVDEAFAWARRVADLRPNSPKMTFQVWYVAANRGDKALAAMYLARLRKLDAEGVVPARMRAALVWQPALEKAATGDVAGALDEAKKILQDADARELDQRAMINHAVFFFTALGKLAEAEKWAGLGNYDELHHQFALEAIAARAGDGGQRLLTITDRIRLRSPNDLPAAVYAASDLAYVGRFTEADAALRRIPDYQRQKMVSPWYLNNVEGDIDRGTGKLEQAIPLLRESLRYWDAVGFRGGVFLAAESLARAFDARGETSAAIAVLEPLEGEPRFDVLQCSGPTAPRFLLSTLYRKAGRVSDARRVEAELSSFLRFADPDYPLAIALKKQASRSAE